MMRRGKKKFFYVKVVEVYESPFGEKYINQPREHSRHSTFSKARGAMERKAAELRLRGFYRICSGKRGVLVYSCPFDHGGQASQVEQDVEYRLVHKLKA